VPYITSHPSIQNSTNPAQVKAADLTDETIALFAEYASNKSIKIRDKIMQRNRPLVVYVLNRFYGKNKKYQSVRDDLLQEGMIGLMTAVGKFNYELGNKFSTYAIWWIRQSIDKFILNYFDTIRTPIHINMYRTKAARFKREFAAEFKRPPTKDETREFLGISEEVMDNMQQSVKNQHLLFLEDLLRTGDSKSSGDSLTLYDTLTDGTVVNPDQDVVQQDLLKTIEHSLHLLTKRELQVLLLRYGVIETAEELKNNKFINNILEAKAS
jgi:RNA polymerase sigma factor (sigma-70 family)